jgi:MFS transporter, DHA1 family, multidrug resistance protein
MVKDRAAGMVVFGRFFTSIGYYLVIPFLTAYLVSELGASAAEAGFLFAVLTFARRGTAIPAGWASDRYGPTAVLVAGLSVEAAAYLVFAASATVGIWAAAAALHGLGGSLTNMGSRSILVGGEGSAIQLSRYYVMVNAAALVGPLAGSLLVERDLVRATFLTAAALDLLFAVAVVALLGRRTAAAPSRRVRLADMADSLRDRDFLRFCVGTLGCWFLLTQLYVALPLAVAEQSLPIRNVGILNAVNAVVVMVCTWFLGRRVQRLGAAARLGLLAAGGVVMAAGWWVCLVPGLAALAVAVVVVSVGESLFLSVVDVLAAAFAPAGRTGLYLGTSTMAWAVGATGGSLLGGAGFAWASRSGALSAFWVGLGLAGAVSAALVLGHRERLRLAIGRRLETSPRAT